MVADDEGGGAGEGEDGRAEEVRAAEQVSAVRAQGLHASPLGSGRRRRRGALPMRKGWDRGRE